jgi:hypothetical protein
MPGVRLRLRYAILRGRCLQGSALLRLPASLLFRCGIGKAQPFLPRNVLHAGAR